MTKYHPGWTDKDGRQSYYCGNCETPGLYIGKPDTCPRFTADGEFCDIPIIDEKDLLLLDELKRPGELTEFAAWDAARALVINWLSALRDGEDIEILIRDVQKVTYLLTEWRVRLTQKYAKEGI